MAGHVVQRADYLAQVIFVYLVQMLLCVILLNEIMFGPDVMTTLGAYPNNYWLIISRFVCAIVLHMCCQDELR